MKKNISDYVVAVAVISCSAVLLGALTVALMGWSSGKERTLEVNFADVTGVHTNSKVRYAGAPAGKVMNVRLLTPEELANAEEVAKAQGIMTRNAVRVLLSIDETVPEFPKDIRVAIGSDSLLGEKF